MKYIGSEGNKSLTYIVNSFYVHPQFIPPPVGHGTMRARISNLGVHRTYVPLEMVGGFERKVALIAQISTLGGMR